MSHRLNLLRLFTFLTLVLAFSGPALAGIGGPYGEYSMAYQGSESLTLLVVPDGSGDSFAQAYLPYGGREDATITLTLRDANWVPVANFPREDIWLESQDGGLVPCLGGSIADANTDSQGMTRWTEPPRAGGHSESLTEVRVNGATLELTTGVKLGFNSPDINGDRAVNLTDVQIFSYDFFAGYDFRSDFHRDGVVNLSDLAEMSNALSTTCP